MFGTYLLVFVGPGSVILGSSIPYLSSVEALTFTALAFGGTVAVVIVTLGRYSGAHINPAITFASTLAGFFKRELFVPYIAFQVIGGVLAGLSLKLIFGRLGTPTSLGSTKFATGISPIEGLALEILGTFVLAVSALSAFSFIHNPVKQALLVGITLFTLVILIGPLTGGSFNPARTLGPSLFSGYLDNQLIYWVGPLLGAGCAGLIFSLVKRYHGRKRRLAWLPYEQEHRSDEKRLHRKNEQAEIRLLS